MTTRSATKNCFIIQPQISPDHAFTRCNRLDACPPHRPGGDVVRRCGLAMPYVTSPYVLAQPVRCETRLGRNRVYREKTLAATRERECELYLWWTAEINVLLLRGLYRGR